MNNPDGDSVQDDIDAMVAKIKANGGILTPTNYQRHPAIVPQATGQSSMGVLLVLVAGIGFGVLLGTMVGDNFCGKKRRFSRFDHSGGMS